MSLSRPRSAYTPSSQQSQVTGLEYAEGEPHSRTPAVPTSTTPYLPGYHTIKLIGTVYGMATVARKESKTFLKVSGTAPEKGLTHMLYDARAQATERMVMDCITRGGNAIIGMSFGESEVMGSAVMSVSGTAVYVEREAQFNIPASPA